MSHPRGVFHQKYDGPGGCEVLVAVNRDGKCVAQAVVPPRADRSQVVRSLQQLLRRLDPPPPLRLVT